MATYLIAREITITRQEGDVADIVITVPAILSMTGRTVKFEVRNANGSVQLAKTGSSLTVTGQIISIPLLPADTEGKPGKFTWECEISDANGPITIGKGAFVIVKTDIKST